MITSSVQSTIEKWIAAEERHDVFVVDVVYHQPNNKLEAFVDSDTSLTLDDCARINRYVQEWLDEDGRLGEVYTLDVSSPGISRPITLPRQFQKNIGRKIELKLEGSKETGIIIEADETSVTIEYKARITEGKRKKTVVQQQTVKYDDIRTATIKIMF